MALWLRAEQALTDALYSNVKVYTSNQVAAFCIAEDNLLKSKHTQPDPTPRFLKDCLLPELVV